MRPKIELGSRFPSMSPIKMMGRLGRMLSMHSEGLVTTVPGLTAQASTIRKTKHNLTMDNMNPNLIKLQYAVRGPIVARSLALKKELLKGVEKPFKTVINANLGDAQAMGQEPITFFRQVLSCVIYPELIKSGNCPDDVKQRARQLLAGCGGKAGSYTQSFGVEMFRRHVAEYIAQRDGYPSNWENVVLTQGASPGIKYCLQLFCKQVDGKDAGVLIPIPQYPLYSAALAEYGLGPVGYYLDEDKNWGIDVSELERAFHEGSKTHAVRALVVINPGNPTGQVLTEENMKRILKFAQRQGLFVLADEVYQHNVYAEDSKFSSFKKVLMDLGPPCSEMELASFMSVSKGYMGECGLRGGWMELVNMDPDVQANLYKTISASICPNTIGQCAIDMVARPPQPGEPSYDLWLQEKTDVLGSFKLRAKMIVEAFNKMGGFKCNEVQGAMYAFPRIELPPKAVEAARAENKPADLFYAFRLLEETGICIVPGSGFGQSPGTYHFRTTILPQPKLLQEMLNIFDVFHKKFTEQYS
ncbi:hypothetical protein PYW08_013127 [Mythimna loreyi]|uniref:Uncharacterized protein n=1 Tax=Mythimna loreyi TaxID=667449 RepID=A0ACC2QGQ6_9NEOP|nr:hypothetical protein PYW08_013127 [Mythimna loreyi]